MRLKKNFYKYLSIFTILFVVSCSTRKDAFLNRSFHSVTAKYNILYNGQVAFDQGIQELYATYKDDYWKRLPIERLEVSELAIPGVEISGGNSSAAFEKSEEKAVKAVQKHSMNISGKEKNKQIDDAFLLLGKSRYYSQRFVPALEAFNYIVLNYPNADLINETKIWQAKSYLRLQNEELALITLQRILQREALVDDKKIIESVHTAAAMVYTVMDSTAQVVHHLKQATLTDYDKEQTARNTFILGQIYREQNHIDSSNVAFQKVIDMKRVPYRYRIHAEIEIAKNLSNDTDTEVLIATLNKLIADRENRPYLDELHYHTGLVHQKLGRIDLAEEHFVASVHAIGAQQFQQGLSYEALGNIQFDKANYVDAGSYYDSVLQIPQDRNTKRIRRLDRKRKSLDEVIYFESIANVTDSILGVVAMNKEEQVIYFQEYIDWLKAEEAAAQQQIENTGFGSLNDANNDFGGDGKWYFYNSQIVGFGQQEFYQIWGNRPLEDNWRLSDKSVLIPGDENVNNLEVLAIEDAKKYDLETYLERIPTDKSEIDSIGSVRNEAYYKLGLIYKEQFKQFDIASYNFEDLLSFNPEEKYILPTKFHLYQIYLELNPIKADKFKTDIVSNYPESKYTQLILNPDELIDEDDANSPENIYKNVYYAYQEGNFEEVITKSEEAIIKYKDQEIVPKFELLRAYAIGKRDGVAAFREVLVYVAFKYSNTEEGKKATEVIETINKL
ncbi:MAG: hypothetical protein BM563_10660 [Bacteroidetes bacterium MedPE-SWsnd-G1]|nr:MAG: hypothetical protein BM563_10660 [Bacteroidetes bacterium MedPE-SWsnd-G1]